MRVHNISDANCPMRGPELVVPCNVVLKPRASVAEQSVLKSSAVLRVGAARRAAACGARARLRVALDVHAAVSLRGCVRRCDACAKPQRKNLSLIHI